MNKGFTLIEVLIYLAVVAATVPLLLNLFQVVVDSGALNKKVRETQVEAARALQIITQAARNGSVITKPELGASGGELQVDNKRFFAESGQLKIQEDGGAAQLLIAPGFTIANLQFTNSSKFGTPGFIKISFKIKKGDYEKIYYGAAGVRVAP